MSKTVMAPMTIKKLWLKICQFLIQDRSMRAQKLRIGPGRIGRIQPTMPAMAKINPTMMSKIFKWFVYFLIGYVYQLIPNSMAYIRACPYHLQNDNVK
jgi:hypothetical protein